MSQKVFFFFFVQAPQEIQYPEPTVWHLKHPLYGLRDSPRPWQIRLTEVFKRMHLLQMRSDPCVFAGRDSSDNVNFIAMAYVDDLVVSGESASVQKIFQESQKTFSLKYIDYLTSENLAEFLGRVIKKSWSGQITIELAKNSLTICWVSLTSHLGSPQLVSRFSQPRRVSGHV